MTIWLLARSTGFVALLAFTASTVLGALAASRTSESRIKHIDRRFLLQMAHRSAAVLGLAMLATHATLIILDSFVNVSISGALIPFTAGYRPFALAAGSLSVYAIAAVAVSGAFRGRLATSVAASRRWRWVHLSAYAGWGLAMAHGIFAGTDTGTGWATWIYVACGIAVAAAVAARLTSESRHRGRPLTTARTLTPRSLV